LADCSPGAPGKRSWRGPVTDASSRHLDSHHRTMGGPPRWEDWTRPSTILPCRISPDRGRQSGPWGQLGGEQLSPLPGSWRTL